MSAVTRNQGEGAPKGAPSPVLLHRIGFVEYHLAQACPARTTIVISPSKHCQDSAGAGASPHPVLLDSHSGRTTTPHLLLRKSVLENYRNADSWRSRRVPELSRNGLMRSGAPTANDEARVSARASNEL